MSPTLSPTGLTSRTSILSAPAPASLSRVMSEGQSFERLGQRDEARRLYERALYNGVATSPSEAAQLLRWVARTYLEDAQYPAAEDAVLAALAVAEQANDEVGRGHAINILAIIRWKEGDLDEATRLYLEARASAQRAGELRLAAMTATNLGVIATVRGDDADALRYHESSLRDARVGGLADEALKALNNLGLLHTHCGRLDAADRAYGEALEIGRVLGDLSVGIIVELNLARLRIRQGDYRRARAACDSAMAMARQLGDSHADGEAEHLYGVIARAAGDGVRAEDHFLRAEASALRQGDLILQGETARELAELYRSQGRNRQTLQRLNQAHRLFAQLRARRELADVDHRTGLLENDFLDVVRKWGDSIESKDVYTQGHCLRVADLACALWTRVNSGDDTSLFWFRIGALLHDVGKLMVPAEVLNKPGKLTDEEWAMVRRHPTAGVELLADIEFPWDVRPIVESHHERWDGKGYPHGLAGAEIPLTARVLCIADVYDALTSQRSYKKAFTHDEALDIMRADVGRQFDPALFPVFEEIVRTGAWSQPVGYAPLKLIA
jgi:putative nucleotidyltransferase with HDIG domain